MRILFTALVCLMSVGVFGQSLLLVPSQYSTIQTAINSSVNGDTILVSPGVYYENIDFNGKNIILGSLYLSNGDESYIGSTIIDGNQSGSVVTFNSSETSLAQLIGLTVQNGNADDGGGIFCGNSCTPTLDHLYVVNNTANQFGGGIYLDVAASATITHSLISNNQASGNNGNGGGIGGTGLFLNATIENCTILGNAAWESGSGIYIQNVNPSSTNVQIINTILRNEQLLASWLDYYEEISSHQGGSTEQNDANFTVSYSLVRGGWSGTGILDVDPLFCNPDNGDFTLYDNSPCVGTGEDGANMGAYGVGCYVIDGCTNSTAINYNPEATSDDGSCYHEVMTDIDGNEYQAVQIGGQLWMKENLKVTHYRNGDEIPTGYSNSEWNDLSSGAYSVYDDNESNGETYGYLYNWYATDGSLNIAPEGWHMPTDEEWTELINYLGSNSGSQLAGNVDLWAENSVIENNDDFGSSGFNALPGSYRYSEWGGGYPLPLGYRGLFWSSTESNSLLAWSRTIYSGILEVERNTTRKQHGFSVRCVRNQLSEAILIPQDYPTIQAGIDASTDGDTVLVSAGTYIENINFNGKNIVVGSLYLTTSDTSYISSTIIDGNQSGSVVTFNSGESGLAELYGFTITNGSGYQPEWCSTCYAGGGIMIENSSPKLSSLFIESNDVNINGNTNGIGGGIYFNSSNSIVNNCIIRNNQAHMPQNSWTCELFSSAGSAVVVADNNYLPIPSIGSNVEINNTLIHNNIGSTAINVYSNSHCILNYVTLANHQSAMHIATNNSATFSSIYIKNSIIWFNGNRPIWSSSGYGNIPQVNIEYSNLHFGLDSISNGEGCNSYFNNINVNWAGSNIMSDPLFVADFNNNYNLQNSSPCIDAADPNNYDPDGTISDMGAVPFYQIFLGCTDTLACNYNQNANTNDSSCVFASNSYSYDTIDAICDTYTWNGVTYTTSGVYDTTLTNVAGCDSVATLNLTINYSNTGSTNVTACDSYDWNGTTYIESGIETWFGTNVNGCDSTATLNLTLNYSNTGSTNVTACDTYTWNGVTYTESGTETWVGTNVNGCDSTATINLTINSSTSSTDTQTACDTYTWNGVTYTESGTETWVGTNVNGCDSTATINLTINSSTSSTDTLIICQGDSVMVGNNIYYFADTYTDTLTSSNGCDSILTTVIQTYTQPSSNLIQGSSQLYQGETESYVPYPSNDSSIYIWGSTLNSINYTSPSGDSIAIDFIVLGNELIYFIETTSDGCNGDTVWLEILIEPYTGINQIQIDDLNIYPNPSKDVFNIEFSSLITQKLQVIIINSIGDVVFIDNLENHIGQYKKQINLKEYSKAIYFLEIQTNDGVIYKKLVLQ